jgi:hypothetical protein
MIRSSAARPTRAGLAASGTLSDGRRRRRPNIHPATAPRTNGRTGPAAGSADGRTRRTSLASFRPALGPAGEKEAEDIESEVKNANRNSTGVRGPADRLGASDRDPQAALRRPRALDRGHSRDGRWPSERDRRPLLRRRARPGPDADLHDLPRAALRTVRDEEAQLCWPISTRVCCVRPAT